jgi:hypothetical protein
VCCPLLQALFIAASVPTVTSTTATRTMTKGLFIATLAPGPVMGRILVIHLIVAILAISIAPLFAQGEQPNIAKLKADARNLVGIIGSNKTKTQTYCQIANLGEQMTQALQEKDKKKFVELAQKLSELQKNLGPEYVGLLESLGNANLTPKDGQEIVSMFDTLEESCPH